MTELRRIAPMPMPPDLVPATEYGGRGYLMDEENKAKVRAHLPKPAVLAAE